MAAYEALPERQKRFVDGITQGMAQGAAYASAGYSALGADQNAGRMMKNDQIREAIAEVRAPLAKLVAWDRDRLSQEWLNNLELARSTGQLSAANTALDRLGRHLGLSDGPEVAASPQRGGAPLTATRSVVDRLGRHLGLSDGPEVASSPKVGAATLTATLSVEELRTVVAAMRGDSIDPREIDRMTVPASPPELLSAGDG